MEGEREYSPFIKSAESIVSGLRGQEVLPSHHEHHPCDGTLFVINQLTRALSKHSRKKLLGWILKLLYYIQVKRV